MKEICQGEFFKRGILFNPRLLVKMGLLPLFQMGTKKSFGTCQGNQSRGFFFIVMRFFDWYSMSSMYGLLPLFLNGSSKVICWFFPPREVWFRMCNFVSGGKWQDRQQGF